MSAFVVEIDEEGFVRSLIGPFEDWDEAQTYAGKKEAAYEGHCQEPYTVMIASEPK